LPDDGASSVQAPAVFLTLVRGITPRHVPNLRSPRPGVSPLCPEHSGLASFLGRSFVARLPQAQGGMVRHRASGPGRSRGKARQHAAEFFRDAGGSMERQVNGAQCHEWFLD
jgi:hypothetical protein